MSSSIQNLLQSALGDGARSTKFDAMFQFTSDNPDGKGVSASVKTASFPGKTHNPISLKMKGRPIQVRGSVKYSQSWECTFYMSEDHNLKHAFELWIEALDGKHNYGKLSDTNNLEELQKVHSSDNYFRDINVYQLNFDESENKSKYTLHNAFPISVSDVATSYEGSSSVLEFTVIFSYTHYIHEIMKGAEGNFLDGILGTVDEINNGITAAIGEFVSDQIGDAQSKLDALFSGDKKEPQTTKVNNQASNMNNGGASTGSMPSSNSRT